MAGYAGHPRYVPVHLEQAADAVVPQVMKVQVFDLEELAGPGPGSGNRLPAVGEDLVATLRHALQDRPGLAWQVAPNIVADLLSWVFHMAHQDGLPVVI